LLVAEPWRVFDVISDAVPHLIQRRRFYLERDRRVAYYWRVDGKTRFSINRAGKPDERAHTGLLERRNMFLMFRQAAETGKGGVLHLCEQL
jgi:hypothetical protein